MIIQIQYYIFSLGLASFQWFVFVLPRHIVANMIPWTIIKLIYKDTVQQMKLTTKTNIAGMMYGKK